MQIVRTASESRGQGSTRGEAELCVLFNVLNWCFCISSEIYDAPHSTSAFDRPSRATWGSIKALHRNQHPHVAFDKDKNAGSGPRAP